MNYLHLKKYFAAIILAIALATTFSTPAFAAGTGAVGDHCVDYSDCASAYCSPNSDQCESNPSAATGSAAGSQVGTGVTGSGGSGSSNQSGLQTNPSGSQTTPPASRTNSANSGSSVNDCGVGYSKPNGICIPDSPFPNNPNAIVSNTSVFGLISQVLKIILTLSGIIAVVFLIVGGFQYLTSAGNEESAEKGRKTIVNAIIGLAVIMLSYAIVTLITNTLTKGIS